MYLLDEAVLEDEAMPGGRLRAGNREDIKEGSPVGVANSISDGQEDGRNQDVLLYSDRRSTT